MTWVGIVLQGEYDYLDRKTATRSRISKSLTIYHKITILAHSFNLLFFVDLSTFLYRTFERVDPAFLSVSLFRFLLFVNPSTGP